MDTPIGDNAWNKEPWNNSYVYGPGIRISPDIIGKKLGGGSLFLYFEYLNIGYFSDVEKSLYEDLARDDIIAGIEFWIAFGATGAVKLRR